MIRVADLDDLPALVGLETRIFGPHAWTGTQLAGDLHRDGSIVIVAVAPGVVGYAIGWSLVGDAELLRIGIDPDSRQRGMGRLLLDAFHAACGDAEHVFLEVRASNESAIRLYNRAGYAVTGHRRGYYSDGESAVMMTFKR